MRRRAAGLLAAALALALNLAACGHETGARPPLWRVSDRDTTVWLLGTVHLLPRRVDWQTPVVQRAIAGSDALWLETPPAAVADEAAAFDRAAAGTGLPPIAARLPAADRAKIAAAAARADVPVSRLDASRSWAAAVLLGSGAARAAGGTIAHAPEAVLADAFKRAGKPVAGLETIADQFAAFDRLSEADARTLLRDSVEDRDDYARTLVAWRTGDLAGLARAEPLSPTARATLVTSRNRAWTARIAGRMARPGSLLVAVGSGHLVGPDALPALLARAGYRIQRVE